jgi:hypothetical protein
MAFSLNRIYHETIKKGCHEKLYGNVRRHRAAAVGQYIFSEIKLSVVNAGNQ